MAIRYHPKRGSIVICDFSGFRTPEMTKRRPVIVISPQIDKRIGLCTVVAMSTTTPKTIMPYHYQIRFDPLLPSPYDFQFGWVKGDMIYSVSFDRLNLLSRGRNPQGDRIYDLRVLNPHDLLNVEACVRKGLGL